jgi:hypothetical protein
MLIKIHETYSFILSKIKNILAVVMKYNVKIILILVLVEKHILSI